MTEYRGRGYFFFVIAVFFSSVSFCEVFLPGMQPLESGIEFVKVQQCRMCHSKTDNGDFDPFVSWQSGMLFFPAISMFFRIASICDIATSLDSFSFAVSRAFTTSSGRMVSASSIMLKAASTTAS